jgi:hypothetical protein
MYDKIPIGQMEDTCFFFERFKNDRRHSTTRETTATMGSTTCETLGARLKTLVGDHGGKGGKRKPGTSGALEETLEVRATTMLNLFFFLDLKILDDDARENPVRTLGVRG